MRANVSDVKSRHDLVAEWVEPKRIKGWVNIYPVACFDSSSLCETRREADTNATKNRIACIEIDILEGQGL